jgi:hypothetical protein
MKGFSDDWRALIHSFVSGGSVAIKVNDDTGYYFQTKKGLLPPSQFIRLLRSSRLTI